MLCWVVFSSVLVVHVGWCCCSAGCIAALGLVGVY